MDSIRKAQIFWDNKEPEYDEGETYYEEEIYNESFAILLGDPTMTEAEAKRIATARIGKFEDWKRDAEERRLGL